MKIRILLCIGLVLSIVFCWHETANFAAELSTEPIKLVSVHSYTVSHICTAPQIKGMYTALSDIPYEMYHYFLNAKTANVTTDQRNRIGSYVVKKILKDKPDYVFITDDVAFEYVGIPLAKKGIKMLVSGLNRQLHDYYMDKSSLVDFGIFDYN